MHLGDNERNDAAVFEPARARIRCIYVASAMHSFRMIDAAASQLDTDSTLYLIRCPIAQCYAPRDNIFARNFARRASRRLVIKRKKVETFC